MENHKEATLDEKSHWIERITIMHCILLAISGALNTLPGVGLMTNITWWKVALIDAIMGNY